MTNFYIFLQTKIEISKNPYSKNAVIIWLKTSGGVKIAPKIKQKTNINFLFVSNNESLTKPDFISKINTSGVSKINPKMIKSFKTKVI